MRFNPSHKNLPRLTWVWIETGNRRNPLACIWIDERMTAFRASGSPANVTEGSPTAA